MARRLRHVAGSIVKELHLSDHVVICALPSSRHVLGSVGAATAMRLGGGLSNWQVVIGESV